VVHTGWPETDIMILPGVEITTCLGHFNIFGCTGAPSQLLDMIKEAGEEDIWEKMKSTIWKANVMRARQNHRFPETRQRWFI